MKTQIEDLEASEALAKARELQENATQTAQKAARATIRYVEGNPWKAIALVAITALALGFMLRRTD